MQLCRSSAQATTPTPVDPFEEANKSVRSTSRLGQFWMTYIDMVQLVPCFIRATRTGNWPLHLAYLHRMLLWFFQL